MIDYAIGLARGRNSHHPEAVVEGPIHFCAVDFAEALEDPENRRRRPTAALEDARVFSGITRGRFSSTPPPVIFASPFILKRSNSSPTIFA